MCIWRWKRRRGSRFDVDYGRWKNDDLQRWIFEPAHQMLSALRRSLANCAGPTPAHSDQQADDTAGNPKIRRLEICFIWEFQDVAHQSSARQVANWFGKKYYKKIKEGSYMSCRDCKLCTESPIKSLLFGLPRLAWRLLTFWNIGLFQRRCPQCKHLMSQHQRRADGSFRD